MLAGFEHNSRVSVTSLGKGEQGAPHRFAQHKADLLVLTVYNHTHLI